MKTGEFAYHRQNRFAIFTMICSLGAGLTTTATAGDFSRSAVGTTGSEFLNVDVGPRGIAMGVAYSAVTADAFSLYWNPAGLSQVPKASFAAMHNEYLAGIKMQYLAYAHRLDENSVLAGGLRYMDVGPIDGADINGNPTASFRPRNYVYEAGWGQKINDLSDSERDISLGVTGRFLHSDLLAHADGFAGDLGVQAHYTEAALPFQFSFVAQNMGKGQKFDQVRDTLPFRGRFGAAIQPNRFSLASLELVLPASNQPFLAVGSEMVLETPGGVTAALRGGYNSFIQTGGVEGFRGLSFGFGVKLMNFSVDYAFVPFGILGDSHRVSVGWNLPGRQNRRFRER